MFLSLNLSKYDPFKKYLDKYCIRVTSSNDETLCQHAVPPAGPKDFAGNIAFKYNGELVENLQRGFKEYVYCMDMDDVDIANDEFQFQSSNTDGACITSLSINGNKLSVGKNNDLQSFWVDGTDRYCFDDFMSTSQITIKNGQIDSSDCKPINQAEVIYGK